MELPPPPGFSEGTPPFWVPPLSEANLKSYPLFLRTIQIGACKLYYMYYSLKCRCYVSYCTKSIENIIVITFYTFRLNSVFTTDSLDRHCHVMFFIFAMQEERTWDISNNYAIKSDACIKLKYIRISVDIYQHISYLAESKKKEEINMSTMKIQQMPNKWQYLACIKASFSNQNLWNDIVTPRLQHVNESCIIIKLIWTIFPYNQN